MEVVCQHIWVIDSERPAQGIRDLKKAGFDNLMAGIGVWFPDVYRKNKTDPVKEKDLRPIAERYHTLFASCKENGIQIPVVYGPFIIVPDILKEKEIKKQFSLADGSVDWTAVKEAEEERIRFGVKAVRECIEFCGNQGVKYLMVSPVSGDGVSGREWEINHRFYGSIAAKAQECGVCILLKNLCREVGGHTVRGICAESSEAVQWIDQLNAEAGEEVFGFCVDTGICTLCGKDMHTFTTALGKRVKAVILRDGDGHSDTALLPFTCARSNSSQTDWKGLIRGLRETKFDGALIVDFTDTAGAFSPLLRPALFQMAREIGDFFRWQITLEQSLQKYESIVLFGAGNMCRNYMKCYGEKYPPLFTCDNNSRLWGSQFCGLEVKNPQDLKTLPANCGVYICNIYYQEIAAQLRDMGIANIEYFNDEYLPSYHTDRLEQSWRNE